MSLPTAHVRFIATVAAACMVASCGGDSTAPLRVSSIVLTGVPVAPLLDGNTAQLIATPVNASGAVVSNASVSWRSSDPSIATVSPAGLVLAVGAGAVTITASANGGEGTATLDVRAGGTIPIQGGSLSLLGGAVTLDIPSSAIGQSLTIMVRPTPAPIANANLAPGTSFDIAPSSVTFFSGIRYTVRYDAAKLPAGVAENTLQLYAVSGGGWHVVPSSAVNTSTRTVSAMLFQLGTYAIIGTWVDHMKIGGTVASGAMYGGQTAQLTGLLFDVDNHPLTGRTVTWRSSDPSRATVDTAGVVTAKGAGAVTISASCEGKSASTDIAILDQVTADWSHAAEWTTFQGNPTHTGYVAATLNPAAFKERWVAAVADGQQVNQVAVGPGRVFASAGGSFAHANVSAFDIASGTRLWTADVGEQNSAMEPAYDNGTVYMQSNNITSYLWGIDAASGASRFRVTYSSQWSNYFAPVIVGTTVFMGCGAYDGLCAQRTSDGSNIWFAPTNQYDGWSPTVSNGVVYAYTGASLFATDAQSGAALYAIPDPHFNWNGYNMGMAPVLGSSNDLLATQGGRLLSFDIANRKLGWEQTGTYAGQVTIAAGVLYVVNNNQVEARNESDGSLIWIWIPPEGRPTAPMVVTNNELFVSTSANTYAVDLAARRQVWSYPAAGRLAVSAQGVLFISQANGKLAAISLK